MNPREFTNECRRKIHRINTRFSAQVSQPMLDGYVNEALLTLFRNNVAKFEINSETRNDLRRFEYKSVELPFDTKGDKIIAKFPKNYYKLTNQEVIADKDCGRAHLEECDGCKNRTINVRILQSGELRDALQDPYWKPSFEWKETIADEAHDGLHVWTSGSFEIKKVLIDYLRKPNQFRCPSLLPEGSYTVGNTVYNTDQPLDWNEEGSNEISDLVSLLVLRDLSDTQEYQAQASRIQFKENTHLNTP